MRDIDFNIALARKSETDFLRVYWGSGFVAYKKNIWKAFQDRVGRTIILPNQFIWTTDLGGKDPGPTINLVNQAPTKLLKTLFIALTKDLYRSIRLVELSDELFPEEYFNPESTPARIARLISTARKWLLQQNYPLTIKTKNNSFRLQFHQPCSLILQKRYQTEKDSLLNLLPKELIQAKVFTLSEFVNHSDLSRRTARLRLSQLSKQKLIRKLPFRQQPTFLVLSKVKRLKNAA